MNQPHKSPFSAQPVAPEQLSKEEKEIFENIKIVVAIAFVMALSLYVAEKI